MSRRTWVAAAAGLAVIGAWAVMAGGGSSEPEPRPTTPRVYSSCLAADTEPVAADGDPCGGR
ncbi:hypothetical protein [Streptomyces sp. NBC_00059]|uniref:hypothetical protein n=1 Tax=Streptomyces sp. NBC_00059 TaxID=2975635 RepID=UPI002256B5A7|nr:hypothetical protein [Streptomyces sp. NBC_00059]MCX5417882.1 hypothetical protein [Streptomyces sp. NBC_00059]